MYHLIERLPATWWTTVCLIIGITAGYTTTPSYALCYAGLILFALLWAHEYCPIGIKKIFFYSSFCILGYVLMYHQRASYQEAVNRYSCIPLHCIGTVTDHISTPHLPLRNKLTITLEEISQDNGAHWENFSDYCLTIQTQKPHESLVGSRIALSNIILKPSSTSFTLFCIRTKLLGVIHQPQLSYTLIDRPYVSLTRLLYTYKKRMLTFFRTQMNSPTFTLFSALFLGNNDSIKKQVKQYQISFQNWGIIHYLARSGLHLVIVTALLEYMLFILPWSFTIGRIIILGCALLYWILSWASLSFYRALAVFVFSQSARIARKQHHFLHLLLFTCSCFLIINPIVLFFLDFQLTFGITIALGLFNYATYKPFI